MIRTISSWIVALALAVASCGRSTTEDGDAGRDEPAVTSVPAPETDAEVPPADEPATDVEVASGDEPDIEVCGDVDERFCRARDRFWIVRSAIYGPPFTESPAEIEALMAESDALMAEWARLAPEQIRPQIERVLSTSTEPIDAMTERLGWDPYAAINTDEVLAIMNDPEIVALGAEIDAHFRRCCPHEEDLAVPTEPLIVGERTIAVYNGTPQLDEALVWALGRFELAGLEVPPIGSATFTVQSEMCDEIRGRYLSTERGFELELCLDERTACWEDPAADPDACAGHCPTLLPGAFGVILHEIAHPWLDVHRDTIDVERFLDHVGLETWRDRDLPWIENGVEHAADTLAWGLMDRDIEMLRIGQPTAEELTEGFRILTGAEPLPKDGEPDQSMRPRRP